MLLFPMGNRTWVGLSITCFALVFSSCANQAGSESGTTGLSKDSESHQKFPESGEAEHPETGLAIGLAASVMPANGVYGESGQIEFQFTWDEPITVEGNPRLPLVIGGSTRYAEYAGGSGTATLVFRHTVYAGDTDADGIEAGASIQSNGGSLSGGDSRAATLLVGPLMNDLSQVTVDTFSLPPNTVSNIVSAPTTSESTLSVSWSVPSGNGGSISHYILQYRIQGEEQWNTLQPNPSVNHALLQGLVANVTYEIRVAASNGVLGPYSSVHEVSIFDVMAFSPIAWLDGADVNGDGSSVPDGTLVETWVDKTGSAENASEPNPALQPVVHANAQNGLAALRFEDLNRGLQGTFTRNNGSSLTIFIVGQYDSGYSDRCMFEFIGTGSARAFFIDRRYASNNFFNPSLSKDEFKLWRIENAGASATVTENSLRTLYSGSLNFNTDFVGTGTYYLGDDSTGGNRLFGYMGELLIFDSELSNEDILTIENYLMTKWGL